ncbi:helix-turn-helix domain-containing protein, partial [Actinomadura sp. NPDC000600]|uniref:helix-turn-helix domain-containing protein n=1 Tax=Actinomadura sp. NPDC000600 TaxID=3154262 RepID=UPI003390C0E5
MTVSWGTVKTFASNIPTFVSGIPWPSIAQSAMLGNAKAMPQGNLGPWPPTTGHRWSSLVMAGHRVSFVDTAPSGRGGNEAPAEQGRESRFAARADRASTSNYPPPSQTDGITNVKTTHVKRAFKYRFYPTDAQAAELSRTFGCVRKVYNLALAART